jgi:hypothetical protein
LNSKLYAGNGYFIKVTDNCYIDIIGEEFSINKNLNPGWNLIGAGSFEVSTNNVIRNCNVISKPQMFVYGATSCNGIADYNGGFAYCDIGPDDVPYCYCEVSTLKPSIGYWIEVANSCILG